MEKREKAVLKKPRIELMIFAEYTHILQRLIALFVNSR